MDNLTYVIYKITNQINGKIYIGRSRLGIKARMQSHKTRLNGGLYSHLRLYKAMAKYGFENFIIEEIDRCESLVDAKWREGELILKANSHQREIGYNMSIDTTGGVEFLSEEALIRQKTNIRASKFKKFKDGYIGVSRPYKGATSWRTSIHLGGKRISYCFKNPIEAAEFYDLCALYIYGKDCDINFPEKREQYLALDLSDEAALLECAARTKCSRPNKSQKYPGVTFHNTHKKWAFQAISLNGKRHHETIFDTEEDAYEAQMEFLELNPSYRAPSLFRGKTPKS